EDDYRSLIQILDQNEASWTTLDHPQVQLGSLVELHHQGQSVFALVLPKGDGINFFLEGQIVVMVITPDTPLGSSVLGKVAGEQFQVKTRSSLRPYSILRVL